MFPWGKLSLNFYLFLVMFLKAQSLAHYYFLYISMILITAQKFWILIYLQMMPICFINTKILKVLESKVNNEVVNIHTWLSANKLSLNIDKSNFIIFHPPQKKLPFHVTLSLNGRNLNQEYSIKYLGIVIDSHLSWKSQVSYIAIKIERNIGILSKLRYYVNLDILVKLYYALRYPFLIYGLISWGNTYSSTTQPLVILQKRAMRMITFSKYHEHSSPIFKHLNIVKLPDLVFLNIAVFMHKFHNRRLPCVFDTFFFQVNKKHNYNTRSASSLSYTLPKVRSNYGIFHLRFKGPKVWNSISDNLKTLSISNFKESLKYDLVKDYYLFKFFLAAVLFFN